MSATTEPATPTDPASGRSRSRAARLLDLLTSTTRRYLLHTRLLVRAAPGLTALAISLTVVTAAASTLMLVATGRFVGALPAAIDGGPGSPAASVAWRWLIVSAVALVTGPLASAAQNAVAQAVSARYLVTTYDMFAEIGTHPYGIAGYDDAALTGRISALHEAMRDWSWVEGVNSTWQVLATRLSGIGAFVVVCTWNVWVALLVVAGQLVVAKVVNNWISSFFDELLDVTGTSRREATYLRKLMTNGEAGKEIRLFGLGDWLLGRYRTTWQQAMQPVWGNRSRAMRPMIAALALLCVFNIVAFGWLAHAALAGAVALGALVSLVQAIFALEAFGPMGDAQTALVRNTTTSAELVDVRRAVGLGPLPEREAVEAGPATPATVPGHGGAAIELDGVGFTYPTRDEPAFSDLTFGIPAGQSVAVVGVNGAGKSTLIKLLCGLYPPDTGTVRIDGADPATDEATRRRVAVIFQDFMRYQLSLRDNVGFGAVGHLHDDAVLDRALTDAGGASLLTRLDDGWDTVLSPEYHGGTDLSGGQWQWVALARALASVADGAGVLVLDEPTAALDVRAEAALFDRFLEVTRGITTVLVSHRLSSVRHADRIVVIGPSTDGRGGILEDGSHAQLLAAGGHYAQMFTLQAKRFAQAGSVEPALGLRTEPVTDPISTPISEEDER